MGKCGFTDPAESQTCDGDAELGSGDVGVEVIDPFENPGGTAVAFRGELLDAGAANGDEGELCGNEETIEQDEDNNGYEPERGTNGVLQTKNQATSTVARGRVHRHDPSISDAGERVAIIMVYLTGFSP